MQAKRQAKRQTKKQAKRHAKRQAKTQAKPQTKKPAKKIRVNQTFIRPTFKKKKIRSRYLYKRYERWD